MKLTSVKMQAVILEKDYFKEWFMPVLRFGKGKKNEFKMALFISESNSSKMTECYNELIKFKGKDIEEIRLIHDEIVERYNDWTPSIENKKPV